jgi:peptide chain release factor 2
VEKKITALESQMNASDFWNDPSEAQKITREVSAQKALLERVRIIERIRDDLDTYLQLINEEKSTELLTEAAEYLLEHKKEIEESEVQLLLSGKTDRASAILSLHPGAGGTESQDWAEMLLRMYNRWAENSGRKFDIIDYQPGDEAGLKSVTVEVMGDYSYGLLKSETGIHRLVRISPFNAQGKRQTSFVSVFVCPLIDEEVEVEIDPADLRIDTYRASGKGGQGVNTTDSAVRITHLPTGIVVSCQNERSQFQNKEKAMRVLRSRLYQVLEEEKQKEKQEIENSKADIGWGNQIRSYVFHPYQMVKDHRTDYETGNTSAVMNGSLDEFMYAYLKYAAEKRK